MAQPFWRFHPVIWHCTPRAIPSRSAIATASMSLDDNLDTPEAAPAPANANTPLDLKNDEVLELMLPVTADDLRPPPTSGRRLVLCCAAHSISCPTSSP